MYTRTFVLFCFSTYILLSLSFLKCCLYRFGVTSCYLVLKKVFCDFCLSGFVMESYKAIILTFSLRMNFLRVADIEHIKSHKGAPSGYTIMP